jgi:hypothetical protein
VRPTPAAQSPISRLEPRVPVVTGTVAPVTGDNSIHSLGDRLLQSTSGSMDFQRFAHGRPHDSGPPLERFVRIKKSPGSGYRAFVDGVSKRRVPRATTPRIAPQNMLVAIMLTHPITMIGAEEGAPSGGPSKKRCHMVC